MIMTFHGGPWDGYSEELSQAYPKITLSWKDIGEEAGFYEHDTSDTEYFFHQTGARECLKESHVNPE